MIEFTMPTRDSKVYQIIGKKIESHIIKDAVIVKGKLFFVDECERLIDHKLIGRRVFVSKEFAERTIELRKAMGYGV